MSHSRRTHLDIFCKLYFAPGFLQKIPSNLAPSSQTLSQQTVPLKTDLERLFTWFLLLLCCPKLQAFFTSLETETSTGRSPPGSLPSLEHTHKCVLPLPTEHEIRGKERVRVFICSASAVAWERPHCQLDSSCIFFWKIMKIRAACLRSYHSLQSVPTERWVVKFHSVPPEVLSFLNPNCEATRKYANLEK